MEATQKKVDFLKTKLDESIKFYESKRQSSKVRAFGLKITALFFSVSTTILLGLEGLGHTVAFKNSALFLSAFVTLLTAWEAFFNHRAMWVRYNMTYTSLLELQVDLEYLLAGGIENAKEEDVDTLNDRRRTIVEETNNFWIDLRKEDKAPSNT